MLKILILFLILNFYSLAQASNKNKIIQKLEKTNNLTFYFKQNIDEKNEQGKCIIKYPKKIYCEYENINKKILVSNGKSLVIKNRNSGTYYIYPLDKTPLEFLLDKNYLIKKINILKSRIISDKYINFTMLENNNVINIFFDKETLDLIGWQTEDMYQNLTITFISSVKRNQKINDRIFILPKRN
ncbi:outer-membrane lipoprotein carrier protein LolA [Candidatus Pelagibacter sp.]|nr:outer-membrane lipoprotein carrier protein LolA [Candidatus Pelagibacter sp.]